MVKIIKLDPIAEEMAVETRSNILSALLSKDLDALPSLDLTLGRVGSAIDPIAPPLTDALT